MNQGLIGWSMPSGSEVIFDKTLAGPEPSILVPLPAPPSRYRSARAVLICRGDIAATSVIAGIQFNGDSAANYDTKVTSAGSSATVGQTTTYAATSGSLQAVPASTAPAGSFGTVEFDLYDYANPNRFKTLMGRTMARISTSGDGNFVLYSYGIDWNSLLPITSVLLFPASGNFIAGTTLRVTLR